jgi:hypothetical protein
MTCMQTLPELYARVVQSDKQLVSPCVKDTTCYMPPPLPPTHTSTSAPAISLPVNRTSWPDLRQVVLLRCAVAGESR